MRPCTKVQNQSVLKSLSKIDAEQTRNRFLGRKGREIRLHFPHRTTRASTAADKGSPYLTDKMCYLLLILDAKGVHIWHPQMQHRHWSNTGCRNHSLGSRCCTLWKSVYRRHIQKSIQDDPSAQYLLSGSSKTSDETAELKSQATRQGTACYLGSGEFKNRLKSPAMTEC